MSGRACQRCRLTWQDGHTTNKKSKHLGQSHGPPPTARHGSGAKWFFETKARSAHGFELVRHVVSRLPAIDVAGGDS